MNQQHAEDEAKTQTSDARPLSNFETDLKKLEALVLEMENKDLPLERSIELFEQGMTLSEVCRQHLQEAETRIEIVMKKDGTKTTEPFRPRT